MDYLDSTQSNSPFYPISPLGHGTDVSDFMHVNMILSSIPSPGVVSGSVIRITQVKANHQSIKQANQQAQEACRLLLPCVTATSPLRDLLGCVSEVYLEYSSHHPLLPPWPNPHPLSLCCNNFCLPACTLTLPSLFPKQQPK